ncbi:hypothetical protein DHW03_12915 [Pedobacter yonginense]|uniref:D-glucuronyl C5-epimerase C-terminal domain-containing protein n=1 Tax=Pedobacter yonginense TaxID=651869 RepID=A0A317ELK9_9SPHI|nr:hypothetical protein [Pedobacter yonginense]PWS26919.1 hypothetical protein DHW03_12915 [Pedobacter yonginense]
MRLTFKIILSSLFTLVAGFSQAQIKQLKLDRVEEMANLPQPLQIIDWKLMAQNFDKTIYDFNAKGDYWPMVWIDSTKKNFDQNVMGIYTAVGDVRQGKMNNKGMFHEALANMGAVMGASLIGIDKSKQNGMNYTGMLKNYFNSDTKWNIMMNNTAPEVALLGGGYGRDWWYDVYPNVLFYAICEQYPNEKDFDWIAKSIAEKFYKADSILNGDYNYSYFDYGKMKPMKNQICAQQDAAAGHAWVLYAAYKKFGDKRYLRGAISAMTALEANKINPTYELLMPFGAYLAARMNVEQGTKFDVQKLLGWTFDGTAVCRAGWGVLTGKWNNYDISGVVGSTVDHGGYGFLMNTFDAAWPLVPLVRYDPAYADAIGKWMLNAVNASRLFYPQYVPNEHQTIMKSANVTKGVIAYEGIAKASTFDTLYMDKIAPVAQGDGPKWVPGKNPDVSQFSVYGSGHVGIFGSIVEKTNIDGVLKLDVLATDFYKSKAYPSYLVYNPYNRNKTITYKVKGTKKVDLYDAIAQKFVAKNISSKANIAVMPTKSVLIVEVPASSKITTGNHKLMANGVVIDYKK